ncbi:MAG: FmdE family protein [Chitinivorax sp.]
MDLSRLFAVAPSIELYDPLAAVLGSAPGGVLRYGFADAVQLSGHACPTVAGAYLMTLRGLRQLYPQQTPQRGDVLVRMRQAAADGTTGVIAQIAGLITGAAGEGGFAGLAGQFRRRGLLQFNQDIVSLMQLVRIDNGEAVNLDFDPSLVPAALDIGELLPQVLAGEAEPEQIERFQSCWRQRLFDILVTHADNPLLVRLQLQPAIT